MLPDPIVRYVFFIQEHVLMTRCVSVNATEQIMVELLISLLHYYS